MNEVSKKAEPAADPQVRYSTAYLAAERRKTRRSTFWGAAFGLIASVSALVEGLHGWVRHEMVDMGVRAGFAKYPPSLVLAIGLIGAVACGCCLWRLRKS